MAFLETENLLLNSLAGDMREGSLSPYLDDIFGCFSVGFVNSVAEIAVLVPLLVLHLLVPDIIEDSPC